MADLLALLADRLAPGFAAVARAGGLDEAAVAAVDPVVRSSDHADAQANGALALAKAVGRNPRDVAADVLAAADLAGVATVEVAGPGFLNLTVDNAFLGTTLAGIAADERLGIAARDARRFVVDYSAPNVAKEMHIGHLRTTVIGDAIVRMLELLGHEVVRENHVGDWGRPFGMLIEHLVELDADSSEALAIADLDDFYKEASARLAADPEFADRARARVVLLQQHDPETIAALAPPRSTSAAGTGTTCTASSACCSPTTTSWARASTTSCSRGVLERLDAAGLLQTSNGAEVVFPPGFTNRDGEPLPLIVRSSAGAYTYATSDLACVADRVERIKADTLVYVVGAPQAQHLAMVFAVSTMAGWLVPPTEAVHVPFGSVLGPGPQDAEEPRR